MFIWIDAKKKKICSADAPLHLICIYTLVRTSPEPTTSKRSTCLTVLHFSRQSKSIYSNRYSYTVFCFFHTDFGKPLFYVLLWHSIWSSKVKYNRPFYCGCRIKYLVYIMPVCKKLFIRLLPIVLYYLHYVIYEPSSFHSILPTIMVYLRVKITSFILSSLKMNHWWRSGTFCRTNLFWMESWQEETYIPTQNNDRHSTRNFPMETRNFTL